MRRHAIALCLLLASATALAAQTPVPAQAVPQGAFAGFLKSTIEAVPIRQADVRLFFIDSTRGVAGRGGATNVDIFVDSLRTRMGTSDTAGYFAIWRLEPGRYLLQVRRIGFRPLEGIVNVASETLVEELKMEPIAAVLNKVEIRETFSNSLSRRLDRVGFMSRKNFNAHHADFLSRGEIDRARANTLRDVLVRHGIRDNGADFYLDRMPLRYDDIQDYPAELIAGIEIYPRGRPVEFNGTLAGPGVLSGGVLRRPLVVIWTYIP